MSTQFDESEKINLFPLDLQDKFYDHLSLDCNYRVIFSAKFGMGKTTFLNEFFSNSKYNNQFISIHLSPINYSVLENQDIFDAIKHDIIVKLQDQHPEVFKDSFQEILQNHFKFIKNNKILLLKVFFQISKKIACLGSDITENILLKIGDSIFGSIFENLEDVYEKYKDDTKDSSNIVKEFNQEIFDGRIKIYEQDIITKVIQKSIEKLKSTNNKKIVLIIDDLDRIDPDHLFRILNVFSSHYDFTFEEKNKFGFSQIITVCDINNIKNIFHHKYGVETSFDGYIDKFISREVYIFNTNKIIRQIITDTLKSIINQIFQNKISDSLFYDDDDGEKKKQNYNLFQSYIEPVLSGILETFVEFKIINFRNMLTIKMVDLDSQVGDDKFLFYEVYNSKHYSPIIYILKILVCIRNSSEQLIQDLNYLSEKMVPLHPRVRNEVCYEIFFKHLLAINKIKDVKNDHKLLETLPKNYPLTFENINFRIKESPFTSHWQAVTSKNCENQITKTNIWKLLSQVTKTLQEEEIL